MNPAEKPMEVGEEVRTVIALPGIPAGTRGVVKEMGRPFVVVAFPDGRHGYYARRQLRLVAAGENRPAGSPRESAQLGLDGLRVPRASHTCLLPSSHAACVDVVTRYAAAGLANSERLVFFMPPRARSHLLRHLSQRGIDAEAAVGRGELSVMSPSSVYLPVDRFDPARQLDKVAGLASQATQEAPNGLRCCGFVGQMYKANGWWQYEAGLTQILRDHGVLTLCVYSTSARRAGIADRLYETHTHVLRDARVTPGAAAD